MGQVEGQGGIDSTSGAAEIRDAFGRLGLRLEVSHPEPDVWEAHVVHPAGTGETGSEIVARGGSEDEAAAAAWRSYVRSSGGIGAS